MNRVYQLEFRRVAGAGPKGSPGGTRTDIIRALVMLVGLVLLLPTTGCDLPGKPNPADRPVSPESVLEFKPLFAQNCAGCHGADGTLGAAPPLHNSLFRAIVPENELETVVSKGRTGTPMPAFAIDNGGPLTAAQVQLLVKEIKGIEHKPAERTAIGQAAADVQGWELPEPPPANAPIYLVAEDQPQRTSEKYEQIRTKIFAKACAGCHGDHGQGGKKTGAINGHAFLSLASDQMLRRIIITGRPDLGMPDFAAAKGRATDFQPLTSEEIADLVALLASWRQGPATAHEAALSSKSTTSSSRKPTPKGGRDGESS